MSGLAPAASATDAMTSVGEGPVALIVGPHDDEKRVEQGEAPLGTADVEPESDSPSDGSQAGDLEKWNEPKINTFRFLTTLFCFIIMGMNDGSLGALLPYIETYYDISYTVVSLLFLAPLIGYLVASLCNSLIHHHFGQRGVAVAAPICRLIGYIPLALHPPYPALPVIVLFPGLGNGLEDSGWNAWIGNMQNANELLGLLHGAYGLGSTIGPLIASAMVTKGNLPWYTFYYVMIGLSVLELACTTAAFWTADGRTYREKHQGATGHTRTKTRTMLRKPLIWLLAIFLLGYVGAEVSLGGWIVTFMLTVRHAQPFLSGVTVTLFWLGLTIGRVILGFVTGRIGEKLAMTIYLLLSVTLEIIYWLVPSIAASIASVILLGFFLGPLFPVAIVAATKLLPSDYHVGAIGFAAAFGGGGAALFPFVVGAIAQHRGVEVLQPIVLALLIFILLIWLCIPGGMKRGGLERARERGEKPGRYVTELFHKAKARA